MGFFLIYNTPSSQQQPQLFIVAGLDYGNTKRMDVVHLIIDVRILYLPQLSDKIVVEDIN